MLFRSLGRRYASEKYEVFSAGTEIKQQINQDAVRLMKLLYHIDMEKEQYSKLITDIPAVDIVITMGCNVHRPALPCEERCDRGQEDPTGKSDEEFIEIIRLIEKNIKELVKS